MLPGPQLQAHISPCYRGYCEAQGVSWHELHPYFPGILSGTTSVYREHVHIIIHIKPMPDLRQNLRGVQYFQGVRMTSLGSGYPEIGHHRRKMLKIL